MRGSAYIKLYGSVQEPARSRLCYGPRSGGGEQEDEAGVHVDGKVSEIVSKSWIA